MIEFISDINVETLPTRIPAERKITEQDAVYLLHEQQLYVLLFQEYPSECEGCTGCDLRLINRYKSIEYMACFYELKLYPIKDKKEYLEVLLNKDYYELYKK